MRSEPGLLLALALGGCASVERSLERGDLAGACRLHREPPGALSGRDPEREAGALRAALAARLQVESRPLGAAELAALLGEAPARPLDLRHLRVAAEAPLRARVVRAGYVGAPVKPDPELLRALSREEAERLEQQVAALSALDRALPPLPPRPRPPAPPAPVVEAPGALDAAAAVAAQVGVLPLCLLGSLMTGQAGACRMSPPSPVRAPAPAPAPLPPDPREEARQARLGAVVDRVFAACAAAPGESCEGLYLASAPGEQTIALEVTLPAGDGACTEEVVVPLVEAH